LLVIDAQCGSCNALLPEVGRWQRDDDGLVVAAISRGAPELNRARAAEHGLRLLLLQDDREVSGAYGAPGTPSAVLVAPDGRVASAVAAGAPAIRALVAVAPRPDPVGAGAIHVNGGSPVEHHPNDQPRPASPDPSARPLPRPDLTTAELDGETVVYDPSNGQVHQLNATATLVWSLCDGERSVDDLARLVAESYAIPLDEARGDVAELVAGLLAANLVVIK
jgi:hypothetical protein